MMRFISVLFLVIGLAAAAYGGARLMGVDLSPYGLGPAPVSAPATVEAPAPPPPPPPPPSAVVEAAPVEAVQPMIVPDVPLTGASSRVANAPEPRLNRAPGSAVPDAAALAETRVETDSASFIDRLYNVPVAYETPKTVAYRKPFYVTFAVDATGDETAVDALPGQDTNVVEASAKISDRIKANLVGRAFEIELESPHVQRVSLLVENVWRWRVTPVETGDNALILELFALEGDDAIPVRTFNDRVEVSVSTFQRAVGLADTANPFFVVLGGIGSAIGGFFGFFRFFARRGKV